MNIPRVRELGLGLFPREKVETNVEEKIPDCDLPRGGVSGFIPEQRSSRASFGLESVEADIKSASIRKSRTSYGLELFEANRSKFRQREDLEGVKTVSQTVAKEPEVEFVVDADDKELGIQDGELFSTDDDSIKLVQKRRVFSSVHQNVRGRCYLIIIPKRIMKQMPKPPDSHVTPPSIPNFYIRVLMVQMSDPSSVDAAVDWLMADGENATGCILGLDCELGPGRVLNLIQLSLHQRCILIRLLTPSNYGSNPGRLAKLLAAFSVVKCGAEVQDDALAIYWATGMVVNGCKNVSEVYISKQRSLGLLSIFRKLYDWEWTKRPEITKSDWGCPELSPKQIKYGIMDAWSSRMVALEGKAAVDGAVTLMSLENVPRQVLDLFGQAITDTSRTEESVLHETSGTLSETSSRGTLQLMQHSFRSRVKGKCFVEMHMKEEQGSVQYKVQSRKGKAVLLERCRQYGSTNEKKSTVMADSDLEVSIESIRSLTVVERSKYQANWQSKRLWESLRNIIRDPATCSKHLLLALGCDLAKPQDLQFMRRKFNIRSEPFTTISRHLNSSQREAWQNILTTPLSATIGPPGTGKTSLITAVAQSWIAARGDEYSQEVLLCTAYQNVAVRHLAETLIEGEVPGVLLLISEDYYSGWHEGFYTQLVESLVVSTSDQCEFKLNLSSWRTRNEGRAFPNVVVCTADMVGCPSFMNSLMEGKVTALIIDESSQASDVSFLRPLISLPDLAMVSVLGDPHQLPPFSAVRTEQSIPSVFDLVSNGCKVNFLREQYRMPPSICEFLSAEIYDNVLMTAPHRLKEKDRSPLVWSHVRGASASAPGKTSLHNIAESKAIIRFCVNLVGKMGVACERVVVLTLYEEQTRRISDDLAANKLQIPVHNVDSFQGQQCDIVLISLVVSRSFSPFAADQRRACVMLSRVRRMLCVFGDFDEVKRNQQAGLWMKLANHCKKRNLVVDEDKVECFLGASVEEAKEMWKPRVEKTSEAELLLKAATTEMPPAGISVQVMFRAR